MKNYLLISIILLFFGLTISVISYCAVFSFASLNPNVVNWSQVKSVKVKKSSDVKFFDFLAKKKRLAQGYGQVSFIAVGDIMLSRNVAKKMKAKNDFNYPFLKVKDYLKTADFSFGNLETPITDGHEIKTGEMIFRADIGVEKALKEAGFSVLSLANNHTKNFGEKGLKDTFDYLGKAGIKYVGAGNNEFEAYSPVYIEAEGIKFAFLAYNDSDVVPESYRATEKRAGTAFMDKEKMEKSIKEAKEKADFVIVSMHSGTEYVHNPNKSQIEFAHSVIDAGAEMVIGHHPHSIQSVEKYKDKYIFYSLGNFVFDQMWSEETREGLMAKLFFNRSGLTKVEFLPVLIEDFSQPKILEQAKADKVLELLKVPLQSRVDFVYEFNKGEKFKDSVRRVVYEDNYKILEQVSSKANVDIKEKKISKDLDKDSLEETYILSQGKLKVIEDGKVIWETANNWWVDDFALNDSNNDRKIDINLSVWKAGNFEKSKPLWVKENDLSIKNHFFVFDFSEEGEIKPVWQSSNLSNPNCEFTFADVDEDDKKELVVIEGEYNEDFICEGKYTAVWEWNGWGFSNEWRSKKGNFSNLEVETINGESHILADIDF